MPTTCGFPNCRFRSRYRGSEDNRHFYRVPKKPAILRKRWLEAIGRTEETIVSQLRVCSGHFYGGEKREGDIPVADPSVDEQIRIELPPKTPRTVQNTSMNTINARRCYSRRGGRGRGFGSVMRTKSHHLLKHGLLNSLTRSSVCSSIRNRGISDFTGPLPYKTYFQELYNRQCNTNTSVNHIPSDPRDDSDFRSLHRSVFDRMNQKTADPLKFPNVGNNFNVGQKFPRSGVEEISNRSMNTSPISNLRNVSIIPEDYLFHNTDMKPDTTFTSCIPANMTYNSLSSDSRNINKLTNSSAFGQPVPLSSAFFPLGRNPMNLCDNFAEPNFSKDPPNDLNDLFNHPLNGLTPDYASSLTTAVNQMLYRKFDIQSYHQLLQQFLTLGPLRLDDKPRCGYSKMTATIEKLEPQSSSLANHKTSVPNSDMKSPNERQFVGSDDGASFFLQSEVVEGRANQLADLSPYHQMDKRPETVKQFPDSCMDLRLASKFQSEPKLAETLSTKTEQDMVYRKTKDYNPRVWKESRDDIGYSNDQNLNQNTVQSLARNDSEQIAMVRPENSSKYGASSSNAITLVVGQSDLIVETSILGNLTNLYLFQADQLPDYVYLNTRNIILWTLNSQFSNILHKFPRLVNLFLVKSIDQGAHLQKLISSGISVYQIPHRLDVETAAECVISQMLRIHYDHVLMNRGQKTSQSRNRPLSAPETSHHSLPSAMIKFEGGNLLDNSSTVSEFIPNLNETLKPLKGTKVGFVGLSATNLAIIQRLKPFGCQLLIYEPDLADGLDMALGLGSVVCMEKLIQQSDWLIIVRDYEVPANDNNSNLNILETDLLISQNTRLLLQDQVFSSSQNLENIKQGMNVIYLDVNKPDLLNFSNLAELLRRNVIQTATVISDHKVPNDLHMAPELFWFSNTLNSLRVKSKELRQSVSNYVKEFLLDEYNLGRPDLLQLRASNPYGQSKLDRWCSNNVCQVRSDVQFVEHLCKQDYDPTSAHFIEWLRCQPCKQETVASNLPELLLPDESQTRRHQSSSAIIGVQKKRFT